MNISEVIKNRTSLRVYDDRMIEDSGSGEDPGGGVPGSHCREPAVIFDHRDQKPGDQG